MVRAFHLTQLAGRCRGASLHIPTRPLNQASGPICTDSRTLQQGQWFLALDGARFDGHDFVDEAFERGTLGCIVRRSWFESEAGQRVISTRPGASLIIVDDTTLALQDLACSVRSDLSDATPVIGITGSSGKTSTKELAAQALRPLGHVHKSRGNFNNLIGLPLTLLGVDEGPGLAAVVLEMGMNCPGELRRLSEIARPSIRLITNIGPVHLEGCGGTLEGVARCKGELFETASPHDTLIVNDDDRLVSGLVAAASGRGSSPRVLRFGRGEHADLQLVRTEQRPDLRTTRVVVVDNLRGSGRHEVDLHAVGAVWGMNVAAALAVAASVDVPTNRAVAALRHFRPPPMRMEVHTLADGITLLDDSYNANPLSMRLAVQTALGLCAQQAAAAAEEGQGAGRHRRRRAVLCLGGMRELGTCSEELHQQVLRDIERDVAGFEGECVVLLVGPEFAASAPGSRSLHFASSTELAAAVKDGSALRCDMEAGDVVLVKGSRGIQMELVVEALRSRGSAQEVAMEI